MSFVNDWLTLQRQTIKEMLKEEDPSYEIIQSLFEKSLNRLQLFIDSQLKNYAQKISDVIYRANPLYGSFRSSEVVTTSLASIFSE